MESARILIVDDEPFNLDYLQQELEDAGYSVITATDGQQALQQVAEASPHLVLLDIMMPVMDGFDVLRQLKKDPVTADLPVIVVSANNSLDSVARGIQLGAEDYLPKPFEPVILHARISSCLEKKRLRDIEKQYLYSLEHEFEIARLIQGEFLPQVLPEIQGWELSAYFQAAHEVAGDYYDAFTLADGSLVCVLGDVCGKGVGAALYMTLFRTLIRVLTGAPAGIDQDNTHPALIQRTINSINDYVTGTHEDTNTFTTLFVGVLDPSTGNLSYANCGNEPPRLLRNGNLTRLEKTGPVIGVFPGQEYTSSSIQLNRGDLLLAFTDGVPDAINSSEERFGNLRLFQTIVARSLLPGGVIANLRAELEDFTRNTRQFDDITMLSLQRSL
jgi:serine phosphatase RsbU (regulator of sigma subunit)